MSQWAIWRDDGEQVESGFATAAAAEQQLRRMYDTSEYVVVEVPGPSGGHHCGICAIAAEQRDVSPCGAGDTDGEEVERGSDD